MRWAAGGRLLNRFAAISMPPLRAANCDDLLAPFADRICRVRRERDARRRACRSCSRRAGNSLEMVPAAPMPRRPCRVRQVAAPDASVASAGAVIRACHDGKLGHRSEPGLIMPIMQRHLGFKRPCRPVSWRASAARPACGLQSGDRRGVPRGQAACRGAGLACWVLPRRSRGQEARVPAQRLSALLGLKL